MLINGKPQADISALDRGLQYGDGLFETIAVVNGVPCLWHRHMQRLANGCGRLGLPMPDPDVLLDEVNSQTGTTQRCVAKIIVTRGCGGRGYRPPEALQCSRIVYTTAWPDYPQAEQGVEARICSTRLGNNSDLAGIKHLNRLEQVMARREWSDTAISEGVMLDQQGFVIEGTVSNLFMVTDNGLITPDLSRCGVAGVMQGLVLDVAREQGLMVEIGDITLQMLRQAKALFLTNSLIGVWPVRLLSGHAYEPAAIPEDLVQQVMARGFTFG